MSKGKIVQVMGPVVDVVFEDGDLPDIKDALEVENNGKKCVMEVSQHLGNDVVRCIMLSASEPRAANTAVTVDLPQPLRPVMPSVIIALSPGTRPHG